MNVHQNARLTPHSRAELVRRVVVEGQTVTAVAAAFGVTVKTVHKWVARFQTEGVKGLQDRSSIAPPGPITSTGRPRPPRSRPSKPYAASAGRALNGGAIVYHRGRGTVYQGGGRELTAC